MTQRVAPTHTNGNPLTVAILGAGGFIGSHMVEHLLAAGRYTIVGIDLSSEKLEGIAGRAFTFHQADVRRAPSLLEQVIRESDTVLDLITYTNLSN